LATLLVELGLMWQPALVYGSEGGARLCAFAAIQISLQDNCSQTVENRLPEICTAVFARLQLRLLAQGEMQQLPSVCVALRSLRQRRGTFCPVMQKWSLRPVDIRTQGHQAGQESHGKGQEEGQGCQQKVHEGWAWQEAYLFAGPEITNVPHSLGNHASFFFFWKLILSRAQPNYFLVRSSAFNINLLIFFVLRMVFQVCRPRRISRGSRSQVVLVVPHFFGLVSRLKLLQALLLQMGLPVARQTAQL
jgi:hypothetical protein